MKRDLLLLTNNFPNSPLSSESWLADEIPYTCSFFNSIVILPDTDSNTHIQLPENCSVANLQTKEHITLNLKEMINCFFIVFSDFFEYPSKIDYFKTFRYNLALIKSLSIKAKIISTKFSLLNNPTIIYAYWADNLLTTACLLKQQFKSCKIAARAHGFEIFEEQTKHHVIPFRKFQSRFSDKIFADSKKGYFHLLRKKVSSKNYSYSYVGTPDHGIGVFNKNELFTIVTCSHIRNVKRLHLMAGILQHIRFPLVWNVIGTGPDAELVKSNNANLPENITVNYLGSLTNKQVLDFLKTQHCNIFVSLSSSEGLPVSMMEAISFGIPLLSTDVGGCNEICTPQTGLLIEKDFGGKDTARLITEFKDSSKNTLEFRKNVRKFWEENFTAAGNYKKFAEQLIEL